MPEYVRHSAAQPDKKPFDILYFQRCRRPAAKPANYTGSRFVILHREIVRGRSTCIVTACSELEPPCSHRRIMQADLSGLYLPGALTFPVDEDDGVGMQKVDVSGDHPGDGLPDVP